MKPMRKQRLKQIESSINIISQRQFDSQQSSYNEIAQQIEIKVDQAQQLNQNSSRGLITKRKKIQGLDKNHFLSLLKLEEKVLLEDKVTVQTLQDIVKQYAKCIEFYDHMKDPITIYFTEKMQSTLVNVKSLQTLIEKQKPSNQDALLNFQKNEILIQKELKNKIPPLDLTQFSKNQQEIQRQLNDVKQSIFSEIDHEEISQSLFIKKKSFQPVFIDQEYCLDQKKAERSQIYLDFIQYTEGKENCKQIINIFEKEKQMTDNIMKEQVELQLELIRQRQEIRKKKNSMKSSFNSLDETFDFSEQTQDTKRVLDEESASKRAIIC